MGRLTIEECIRLPSRIVVPLLAFPMAGWVRASESVEVFVGGKETDEAEVVCRLSDALGARGDTPSIVVVLDLVRVPRRVGGGRWLWACRACSNRVSDLYAPPGGRALRCRRCWQLTYASQSVNWHSPLGIAARRERVTMRIEKTKSRTRLERLAAQEKRVFAEEEHQWLRLARRRIDLASRLIGADLDEHLAQKAQPSQLVVSSSDPSRIYRRLSNEAFPHCEDHPVLADGT